MRQQLGRRSGRRLLSTSSVANLRTFQVERYPGWTDGADSLSSSEVEPLSMAELLSHADDESRALWEGLSLGYCSHNEGSPFLRREILSQYRTRNKEDSLDLHNVNVVVPAEGIYLASKALLSPGDHVVATTPLYQSLGEVARSIGCEVSAWRPTTDADDQNRPRFDPDTLRGLLRPDGSTKLVVCNFPHNPTGALPSGAEFEEVIELCRRAKCHLLVDEMYRNLEHRNLEHAGATTTAAATANATATAAATAAARLPSAVEAYDKGVTLSGLSKTVGLPGIRIGWLASQDVGFMQRIATLKDYTTICPPSPSEVLALIALRAQEPLLTRSRAIIHRGLADARAMVGRHPDLLEWAEPSAGTFSFVKIKGLGEGEGGISSEAYCDALRARANLMLMPGKLFDLDGGSSSSSSSSTSTSDAAQRVRLTYGRAGTSELLDRWSADLSANGV